MRSWTLPTLRSRVRAVAFVAVLPYLGFIAAIAIQWRAHEISDAKQTALALVQSVAAHYRHAQRSGREFVATLDLTWIEEIVAERVLPEGSAILIFDERGILLAEQSVGRADGTTAAGQAIIDTVLRAGDEGAAEAPDSAGVRRVVGFAPLGTDGAKRPLRAAVVLPPVSPTQQVDALLRWDVAVAAFAFAVALVVASAGSKRFVVAPVQALVSAAGQLGRGDARVRVGRIDGPQELAELGNAFDRMAEALEARERESAAARARASAEQRRFQSLIANAGDGILLRDQKNGRVLYASPSTARILGYEPAELLGRDMMDIVRPDDRDYLARHISQIMADPDASKRLQIRIRRKDAAWRWLDLEMWNLHDDPTVGAIVVNYRDATEYREAQEQLRGARDELEARVRQRTADLVKANQALVAEVAERHRAEQAARGSEARFRLLLDSAAEGILGLDETGCCTFCNAAALRLLGRHDGNSLRGSNVHEAIHGARRDGSAYPEAECPVRRALSSSGSTHVDTDVFWRADGTSFPVEYWSHPLLVDGRVVGTVLSFTDITERLRAQETLQKLSSAIEQTADSVFVTDRDGVIEYVNPAFERLTGYSRAEAIGATPRLFASGRHEPGFFAGLWREILSGQVFRTIVTNRTKDGSLYDEDQTISPLRDGAGKITHFVSTGRDITARKRTEQAVRRLNNLLEQETTRIANLLHDEAGQFLTSAHLMIADVARELPPVQRERLQMVRRSLDQVEDQLRTVSHELHPRILQDLGLAEALRVQTSGFSRRTGIAVELRLPQEFTCAPTVAVVLYRLVQEALNNVAKHARASSLSIALNADRDTLSCTVADDGVGFDTGAALKGAAAPSLGLRGMRDRVEALGGTLRITSTPGRGTEVRAVISVEAMHGESSVSR